MEYADNLDKANASNPAVTDKLDTTFEYDTGFLCTYHLMSDSDDDTMSDNLYRIQLAQALHMKMDVTRVLSGHEDEFDVETIVKFVKFISDKTKPCYDDRYKAVLRKHPYLNLSRDYIYKKKNDSGNDIGLDETDYKSDEYYDDIDSLVNDVVPMLLSYHTFHAFHRCIIDMFTLPNATGLISDESLLLLEKTYERLNIPNDMADIMANTDNVR